MSTKNYRDAFAGERCARAEAPCDIGTVSGAATINNSTFDDNNSTDGCGAIYNRGSMTIRNSTFSANKTTGTNSSWGGAICSVGTLAIESSTFAGNYARGYGGAITAGNGTITGSTLKDNFSPLGGDGINGDVGHIVSRSILRSCADPLTSGGDNIAKDASFFPRRPRSAPGRAGQQRWTDEDGGVAGRQSGDRLGGCQCRELHRHRPVWIRPAERCALRNRRLRARP